MARLTSELVQIVEVGGGLSISVATMMTSDLVTIVSAARSDGGTITLRDSSTKMTSDLVQIASAGQGRVVFELQG